MLLPGRVAYHSLAHISGTQECIICIEGDLTLGPEGQEVPLQPGDSVWFSADLPHSYTSTSGARAFLVMKYPPALGVLPSSRCLPSNIPAHYASFRTSPIYLKVNQPV